MKMTLEAMWEKHRKQNNEVGAHVQFPSKFLQGCLEPRNTNTEEWGKTQEQEMNTCVRQRNENTGILEDLVFGTKEYEQHRNYRVSGKHDYLD